MSDEINLIDMEQNRFLRENHNEIDLCAGLCLYMYVDSQKKEYEDKTLGQILRSRYFKEDTAGNKYVSAARETVFDNPRLDEMKLFTQSSILDLELNDKIPNPQKRYGKELVVGASFISPKGDLYVVYRGTGEGKWIDNGQGLASESTVMQQAAAKFYDDTAALFRQSYPEGRIIVTGHSKGGNEAQYVTLAAQSNQAIDRCYSFDGQGFSKEAIDKFIEENGISLYTTQKEKLYGINGCNDFVNPLGEKVIHPAHEIFVPTQNGTIAGYHDIPNMFSKISPGKLNYERDTQGNIVSGKPGRLGRLSASLSREIMQFNKETRDECAVFLMDCCEVFMGNHKLSNKGTGDLQDAGLSRAMGFSAFGLPTIVNTFFDKSGGIKAVYGFLRQKLAISSREKSIKGIIAGVAGTALCTAVLCASPAIYAVSLCISAASSLYKFAETALKNMGDKKKEHRKFIQKMEKETIDEYTQEAYIQLCNEYGYTPLTNWREDYNAYKTFTHNGEFDNIAPEIMYVVSSYEGAPKRYIEQLDEGEYNRSKYKVASYDDEIEKLKNMSPNANMRDISIRALSNIMINVKSLVEQGYSVILDIPNMGDPLTRLSIQERLEKSLNGLPHINTAISIDEYPAERVPEDAEELEDDELGPMTLVEKCAYENAPRLEDGFDFTVKDTGWQHEKQQSLAADQENIAEMYHALEYLDDLEDLMAERIAMERDEDNRSGENESIEDNEYEEEREEEDP